MLCSTRIERSSELSFVVSFFLSPTVVCDMNIVSSDTQTCVSDAFECILWEVGDLCSWPFNFPLFLSNSCALYNLKIKPQNCLKTEHYQTWWGRFWLLSCAKLFIQKLPHTWATLWIIKSFDYIHCILQMFNKISNTSIFVACVFIQITPTLGSAHSWGYPQQFQNQ